MKCTEPDTGELLPMQNPRTMDNPAPSCILVKILATAPAVLMPDVIKLNCPVPLACSIKSSVQDHKVHSVEQTNRSVIWM